MTYVLLLFQVASFASPEPLEPHFTTQAPPAADQGATERSAELAHVLNVQAPGAALRLRLLDGSLREGELQGVNAGVLTIAVHQESAGLDFAPPQLADVPLGGVDTLWVARGDRGVLGAAAGGIVGAAAGVGLALAFAAANQWAYGSSSSSGTALVAVPLTSALGAFVGWQLGKGARSWGKPRWTASTTANVR